MSNERLTKEVFIENYGRECALKEARKKNAAKAPSKPFPFANGVLGTDCKERSKWQGLINKIAAFYEGKIIREAERKRRELKAKTNVPQADSALLATDSLELESA